MRRPEKRKVMLLIGFLFIQVLGNFGFTSPTLAQEERFQKLGVKLDPWAESQVLFWKRIYTDYSSHQFLIHDSMNLSHVYKMVENLSEKQAAELSGVVSAKAQVQEALLRISKTDAKVVLRENLPPTDQAYFDALEANEDPRAYAFAASPARIRAQSGLKDKIDSAFTVSKGYLKRMAEIFEEEGVPKELTLLPFIESAFNHEARSAVGATGIWQFMPATAAKDLRVTRAIDERYDPLKSTRAAARFLQKNHQLLGSWALAVMAYHQGAGLVQMAIKRVGSRDPVTLIKAFKDPNFKFASRNYLFEFLAMQEVSSTRDLITPADASPVDSSTRLPTYITVSFQKRMHLKDILQRYHLNESTLKVLNPHFRGPIWNNSESIPAHYPVRLAGITLEEFRALEYP